jgi:hypothetical protein
MHAAAQKNYIAGNMGYAIPAAGFTYALTSENLNGLVSATSSRKGPNSGFNLGLEMGRNFNSNITLFMGVNYLNGSQKEALISETTISGGVTRKFTADFEASSLRVLPGIKITAGNNSVKPYLKFGAGIYFMNNLTVEMEDPHSSGGAYILVKQTNEYKGRTSFGYVSGIGLDFKLKKASFFIESSFFYQNIVYKTRRITDYSENGTDMLNSLKRSERDVEYSKKYSSYNSQNTDKPAKSPAVSLPFSQISFNAGFLFPF